MKPVKKFGLALTLLLAGAALETSCGGGGGGGSGGSSSQMDTVEVSHGFGQLIPHQIFRLGSNGLPTTQVIAIRSIEDLTANVTQANQVLSPVSWPETATLPNSDPGNHFIMARFTQPLDVESVLDSATTAQATGGLRGTISAVAIDPLTGSSTTLRGRAFVGGQTYAGTATGVPPQLELQKWVEVDNFGRPIALNVNGAFPGLGFPGTESTTGFAGSNMLTSPDTLVFVADSDGNLSTHERFPSNRQIRLKITTSVRSTSGANLARQAVANATVGSDGIPLELQTGQPPLSIPSIIPGNGDTNVDPLTAIQIEFTEDAQPLSVGPFPSRLPPQVSTAIQISFGPASNLVTVPFTSLPISAFDFTTYVITPAFNFPGSGPDLFQCGTFNRINIDVLSNQIADLTGNQNTQPGNTFFFTGEGPGLVNAPVAPDAIYVARGGATPGLSVVDLNGFGGSTGNPNFDPDHVIEGNSNFPNNPNFALQGALMTPPLIQGTCTINGGSAGVFTLTKDSALQDLLVKAPVITEVGEMALGYALDQVFHNGLEGTGCQAGGGNLCAISGRKLVNARLSASGNIIPGLPGQNSAGSTFVAFIPGGANPATWAPHPNPPPLVFPPLCLSPFIGGNEVSSIDNIIPPQFGAPTLTNLLLPGDPFGDPDQDTPPSGLLVRTQNSFFLGPSAPGQMLTACQPYQIRQQIGHFLYMADRARGEVVVLNSNRFTVLDRIPLPDPTSFAMAPNLNFLGVTNQAANAVSFIDIDPDSSTFHQVIKTTTVGVGPRGIAWEPGNEDIFVCNEGEDSVSIISAFDLEVRKVIRSQLNGPFEVAITPRQRGYGFFRNVYFAWILNRSGSVALYESGPNGVNGWGFDDIIGVAPFTFTSPKTIQPDHLTIGGGVWIAHERAILPNGDVSPEPGGAVSNLVIESAIVGQIPLSSSFTPQLRDMSFAVRGSIGSAQLTGIPVDIGFDDQINLTSFANWSTLYSAGEAIPLNGKSIVRPNGAGAVLANSARFMFLAVPNSEGGVGAIDVIDMDGGFQRFDTNPYQPGVQSIPVAGVNKLADYFTQ